MKLTELHATFVSQSMGDSTRIGVMMDCPCGCDSNLYVPFADPDAKTNWGKTGETIETLSLTPSVQRGEPCPKRWHGYITNGEAVTC